MAHPLQEGWQLVIFAAECDEDGNCPKCRTFYTDCPCPGPTQPGWQYREVDGILYARKLLKAVP